MADDEAQAKPKQAVIEALEQFQSAMQEWAESCRKLTPGNPGTESMERWRSASLDQQKILEAQRDLLNSQQQLWMSTTAKLMGNESTPQESISPERGDNRFRDEQWKTNPLFSHLLQTYLLNSRWMEQMLDSVQGLDSDTRAGIEFYNRQIIDALAPTNFVLTNPTVLKAIEDTKGGNLVDGLSNFLGDLSRSEGSLKISQVDESAFEVGVNLAMTTGKVVFRNELFELIQFEATTDKVFKKPLLIVPPWINKYYILDLKPENSFIKWCVEQGHTVFIMSWVNPDETYRDKTFDDYLQDGVLEAIAAVSKASGEKQMTAIGYCIGGTLLSIALAYMAAKGDKRISAATFFAAQVDFEEAGSLRLFTSPDLLAQMEPELERKGYLDGDQMASAFNLLRSNDLIWYFVTNNYLLGKKPRAFELLYWNGDSTRFPARLLLQYLKWMYRENLLSTPGALEVLGEPIDLGRIKIPTYIQASKEDHIAPARSVFKIMHQFSGTNRFVLAGSGHVAGVVNPPQAGRYQHWTNNAKKTPDGFDEWFTGATETPGSWWANWQTWLSRRSGAKVAARIPGDGELAALEAAPGSYVKVRHRS